LPDCQVTERTAATATKPAQQYSIPACDAATSNFPCWRLQTDANCTMGSMGTMGKKAQICRDTACDPNNRPQDPRTALFECAVVL
jgi:hypothetical protein